MCEVGEQFQTCVVFLLALLPFVIYGIAIVANFITIVGGRSCMHKKMNRLLLGNNVPGVSVIKPLMGVYPLLEENLRSHFELDYQKLELLFCVQDDQDPAINVYHKLCQMYPDVVTQLFIGGKDGIINPMVHNMAPAYENVKYEYVWISSARVKVSTDILMDMLCKLQQPNVALCHQMPYFTYRNTFANIVEMTHFGTALARYYISSNIIGLVCATGMSYVFKKMFVDEVNGLVWYGRYLAEDFFLTTALHKRGYKLAISAYPCLQNTASTSITEHKNRIVRWSRLRLNMMPFTTLVEPMADCIPLGLFMSWSLWHFFGINPFIFFSLHLCFWVLCDYIIMRTVENGSLPFSIMMFLAAWLVREGLTAIVFLEAISKPRTIKWGKKTYQLKLGGCTSVICDKSLADM